jgi:hypothetical protein
MANQSSIVMSTSFYIFGEIMNLIESQNPSTCKKQKKNPKWQSPCAARCHWDAFQTVPLASDSN